MHSQAARDHSHNVGCLSLNSISLIDTPAYLAPLPPYAPHSNELSSAEFNKIRGLANVKRTDVDLFKARGKGSKKKRKSTGGDDNGSAVSATQSTATTG